MWSQVVWLGFVWGLEPLVARRSSNAKGVAELQTTTVCKGQLLIWADLWSGLGQGENTDFTGLMSGQTATVRHVAQALNTDNPEAHGPR